MANVVIDYDEPNIRDAKQAYWVEDYELDPNF